MLRSRLYYFHLPLAHHPRPPQMNTRRHCPSSALRSGVSVSAGSLDWLYRFFFAAVCQSMPRDPFIFLVTPQTFTSPQSGFCRTLILSFSFPPTRSRRQDTLTPLSALAASSYPSPACSAPVANFDALPFYSPSSFQKIRPSLSLCRSSLCLYLLPAR